MELGILIFTIFVFCLVVLAFLFGRWAQQQRTKGSGQTFTAWFQRAYMGMEGEHGEVRMPASELTESKRRNPASTAEEALRNVPPGQSPS
jgi:hypothetical protein